MSIQPLPRDSKTLEAVSIVVESAFWGREDKPSFILDAFADFWNVHYSTMEEPASGWPEKIQKCLRAVPPVLPTDVSVIDPVLLAEDAIVYDADVSQDLDNGPENDSFELPSPDDDEALAFPGSEDEADSLIPASCKEAQLTGVLAVLDQSPFVGQLRPAFTMKNTASDKEVIPLTRDLQPPSTPAKVPILTSTPPRPQKPSAISATFLTIPHPSPTTPLQLKQDAFAMPPKGTPFVIFSTSRSSSPSKRRSQTGDKENMSPRPAIASFAERLAMRSPAWSKGSVLGKRYATDDELDATTPKRVKINPVQITPKTSVVPNSNDSEDEKLAEYSLIHQGSDEISVTPSPTSIQLDDPFAVPPQLSPSSASDNSSSVASPRKRKRVFMESVEVLTLREVILRERKASTPEKPIGRRSRTATLKASGLSPVQPVAPKPNWSSSRKRSKRRLSNDPFLSSSICALEEIDIAGSG